MRGGQVSSQQQPKSGPTCFVARPISLSEEVARNTYRGDRDHWEHVEEYVIKPALEAAGYTHIPTAARGSRLIHAHVIRAVNDADLVIADFSQLNANVLFEAGVRTSVNKPLVIIAEKNTTLPFDTGPLNTWFYDPALEMWGVADMVSGLTEHIRTTDLEGNALWKTFGSNLRAEALVSVPTQDLNQQMLQELMREVRDIREIQTRPAMVHAKGSRLRFSPWSVRHLPGDEELWHELDDTADLIVRELQNDGASEALVDQVTSHLIMLLSPQVVNGPQKRASLLLRELQDLMDLHHAALMSMSRFLALYQIALES